MPPLAWALAASPQCALPPLVVTFPPCLCRIFIQHMSSPYCVPGTAGYWGNGDELEWPASGSLTHRIAGILTLTPPDCWGAPFVSCPCRFSSRSLLLVPKGSGSLGLLSAFLCRQLHGTSNKGLEGNLLYYSKKYKGLGVSLNPSLSTSQL